MRSYIGLVVVALTVVGCATEELDTSEAAQELGKGVGTCPDPFDCTLNNGGGVYTEELGTIGLGPYHYMVSRFVNLGGKLQVEGRGFNPNTGNYYAHPATFDRAIYHGVEYSVVTIKEWLTTPTVILDASPPVVLIGSQLAGLQLVFRVDDGMNTLTFTKYVNPDLVPPDTGPNGVTLQQFHAMWNQGIGYQSSSAQEYCTRAPVPNQATAWDPVVFQQGIDVNPITAVMVRNNAYVTLSCRHGSIATARWWGYSYRNDEASADLFEAAMHMKRASYCGDDTFYTRRNTDILVQDSLGTPPVHVMEDTLNPIKFEATWGRPTPTSPIRALCVNKHWRRRPGVNFPPNPNGALFDGSCLSPVTGAFLFTIPECTNDSSAYPAAYGMLADEAVDPPLAN